MTSFANSEMSQQHKRRWESSGKPPIRSIDGRISSSAGGREGETSASRPMSASTSNASSKRASRLDISLVATGAEKSEASSDDSDYEGNMFVAGNASSLSTISKLPPITKNSNASLSRINSSSSKSSISSRSLSQKSIIKKKSVTSVDGGTDALDTTETNRNSNNISSHDTKDLPIVDNESSLPKNSQGLQEANSKKDTTTSKKSNKPVWGQRKGAKLVSKVLSKGQPGNKPNAPKKGIENESSLGVKSENHPGNNTSTHSKPTDKKLGRKGRMSKVEGQTVEVPLVFIPQNEVLLARTEDSLNYMMPETPLGLPLSSPRVTESSTNRSRSASSSSSTDSNSTESSSSDESSSSSASSSLSDENNDILEGVEKDRGIEPREVKEDLDIEKMNVDTFQTTQEPILKEISIPIKSEKAEKNDQTVERKGDNIDETLKSNPLTRLSISQYNLFSNTAGAFRGPGDIYYKFILGGKSVRPGAKRMKKVKIQEVELGKLDEILVEKAKHQTTLWNHKSVSKLREKHKDYLNTSITNKVINLEQTRA